MSRKSWVEISCDECGGIIHLRPGNVTRQLRVLEWVITHNKLDFCSKKMCET